MESVLNHKFPVGSTVHFTAAPWASGTYEVIRQLPSDGDDCQYRIKRSTERFERVAKESQLALLLADVSLDWLLNREGADPDLDQNTGS